jgi:hypothetical protein
MQASELLAALEIKVASHTSGPEYGYFWCNAVSPDWNGPEDSPEDAQRAALRNLLSYARLGKVFEWEGAEAADVLLPKFGPDKQPR